MTKPYLDPPCEFFDRPSVPPEIQELLDEWPEIDPSTAIRSRCRHVARPAAAAAGVGDAERAGRAGAGGAVMSGKSRLPGGAIRKHRSAAAAPAATPLTAVRPTRRPGPGCSGAIIAARTSAMSAMAWSTSTSPAVFTGCSGPSCDWDDRRLQHPSRARR